jgi:hypothetical protein
MNLFSKPKPVQAPPPPQLDEARQNVDAMRRTSMLRGRAASMLTQGQVQAPTAQRANLGN